MVGKIILVGAAFGLTVGGVVVEISKTDKITAGEGNGKSMKFESIEEVKKIIDGVPDPMVYQMLSSDNEIVRNSANFGEDFHSLTLKNKLDRKYVTSKPFKKVSNVGESYQNPDFVGKRYDETDLEENPVNWMDWQYLYSINEKWNQNDVTEKYDNILTSYYTNKGLMLDFDISRSLTYKDQNTIYEHAIFDSMTSNSYNDKIILSTEILESKLVTNLKGAIYITDGTAYLKYDKYEMNYSYDELTPIVGGHFVEYQRTPKDFDERFYAYFPEVIPSESRTILECTQKAIRNNYGTFFNLRFDSSDIKAPNGPKTEEEAKKMSEKQIKEYFADVALAMILPVCQSFCDTSVKEMLDVGNVPMNQLKYNLDYFAKTDEEGKLVNATKKGNKYTLDENKEDIFIGSLLELTGALPKGEYERKCEKTLESYINNQLNEHNSNYFVNLINNSDDVVGKQAAALYKAQIEALDPEIQSYEINQVKHAFEEAVRDFLYRTTTIYYSPASSDSRQVSFTLFDGTAPTFFSKFNTSYIEDTFGVSHQTTFNDSFSILNVDNTTINVQKKIRKTAYDLYKDAFTEYGGVLYDEYREKTGE